MAAALWACGDDDSTGASATTTTATTSTTGSGGGSNTTTSGSGGGMGGAGGSASDSPKAAVGSYDFNGKVHTDTDVLCLNDISVFTYFMTVGTTEGSLVNMSVGWNNVVPTAGNSYTVDSFMGNGDTSIAVSVGQNQNYGSSSAGGTVHVTDLGGKLNAWANDIPLALDDPQMGMGLVSFNITCD
jgi:hypothetical protein